MSKITSLRGFTLLEVLISVAIGSMIMGALASFMYVTQSSMRGSQAEAELHSRLTFALERMVRAVEHARIGFVPLPENPATPHTESLRSILAVSLDPTMDRDRDGWSDANNDRDWDDYDNDGIRDPGEPERIDEDPGHDLTNDFVAGVAGVDDDGDGAVDELMQFDDPDKSEQDDDEDGWKNEDNGNGYDDDGDGAVDEDAKQEWNDDHAPGLLGADDNYDGIVDISPGLDAGSREGRRDDDEDGAWNEDWPEVVVYYLGATEVYADADDALPLGEAGTLYERMPDAAPSDGTQWKAYVIATRISDFSVQRLPVASPFDATLIRISLTTINADGRELSLSRTARLGAAL